jgi:serine phosphatase RsbU (regulator of sigma subunit)/HAMP domain-containing protein
MKFRLTIGWKIGIGFAVLAIVSGIVFRITYNTLTEGRSINDKINSVYNPSVSSLEQLKSTVLRSRTLINMWAFVQSREDTKEKMTLVKVVNEEIPEIRYGIDSLSVYWTDSERLQKEKIYNELDLLLEMYSEVRMTLRDMQSYDDPFARFQMNEYAEEDGVIYQQAKLVIDALNVLIEEQRANTIKDSKLMIGSFDTLESYLNTGGGLVIVLGLLIGFLVVVSITRPVLKLKKILEQLSIGKFPETALVETGDEIGDMSGALEQMVQNLKRTTQFANKLEMGNFETSFKPLSDDDTLGHALISMKESLQRNEQELERKVDERTQALEESNKELDKQNRKIEKQNMLQKELIENITASIRYAKRLQDNILPSADQIKALLPESFIFFKPKDIVSGDFYFVKQVNGKIVFAAVDCTGHGVPGAFMSLVGHNALNHALNENPDLDPGQILTDLNEFAIDALNRSVDDSSGRDGMDMALCVYDRASETVEYAGAFNPLYIVREKELTTYKPDKIVLGSPEYSESKFKTTRVKLEGGDMIYIFSDGYADQFGGEKGKKFMYKPFRKLLVDVSTEPTDKQLQQIETTFTEWRMGLHEQIDDILVMGVRHTK